ncbi:molecular chaperone DnaJ [Novosphingobium fuchskuhlense]|uniref:Molecular chaperone DnaJ n=1 Tax=Novosphingobium fuchskuhlense TaxID=1117702 RepID=A0A117UWW4_9SPHN|nr:DnaJ C-terminal domain-containing protein [Novosphingobium fuchskuhlense]KUR72325.1 molecular chaperone DnaJ [Novosphingobium fuchskuhlense]
MADPYSILGVSRTASEKDIKSAYRTLAKELHPDRNAGKPNAAERFAEVTRAYDLLSDKDKRARFDRGEIDADGNPSGPFGFGGGQGGGYTGAQRGYRHDGFEGFGQGGGEGIDLGDIFEGLFGGRGGMGAGAGAGTRRRPAPRGANVTYTLRVPFDQAARREPQRVTLSDGKTIDLKLPLGLVDGQQVRLGGKGEAGPGGFGDAIVTIEIEPSPHFERDSDNIRLDVPITLDEAIVGAKVRIPTVEGPVMMTVVPGSTSGKTLRLKGRGFTRKNGERGDQLVTLLIDIPAEDPDLKARLEGWRDGRDLRSKFNV